MWSRLRRASERRRRVSVSVSGIGRSSLSGGEPLRIIGTGKGRLPPLASRAESARESVRQEDIRVKRWQATEFGAIDRVLRLDDVPMPEPGPNEALVHVLATSIALPDVMMIRGDYPLVPAPPASPGQEVVGIVQKASHGFPHPVGARIVGNSRSDIGIGGLAEYTLVPGWSALPVMDGLSDEQAVGFPGSFHVAHIGLRHRARLEIGETLLVLGGAGRTGSAAIQVAKAMGADVIATARTDAAARFCIEQGADHVVDLGQPSERSSIAEMTDGNGVDVVYDTVGGQAYADATEVLASSGARVLIVGFASGHIARPDAQDMLMRDYSVAGVISAFRNDTERASTLAELSSMVAEGLVDPPVTSVHPFDQAPEAIAHRATGAMGQTVVTGPPPPPAP
jgi:NADPH2:quinone reductase